jgi:hypothetical protein
MRLYVAPLLFALVAALLIPISASAQIDAECAAVHDANGLRVGRAYQHGDFTTVLLNVDGRVVNLRATRGKLRGESIVFFAEADCAGVGYIEEWLLPEAQLIGNDLYYPDTLAITRINLVSRRIHTGECNTEGGLPAARDVFPAPHATLPTYTQPFHLEPEACYTPDPSVAALTPYGLGAMALVLGFGAYVMVRQGVQY